MTPPTLSAGDSFDDFVRVRGPAIINFGFSRVIFGEEAERLELLARKWSQSRRVPMNVRVIMHKWAMPYGRHRIKARPLWVNPRA